VLEASRAPFFASHSSARALTNSPRNLTDEMLRAVASRGGVVMVNFYSAFISERWQQQWHALRPELQTAHEAQAAECATANIPLTYERITALDRLFASRVPRPPLSDLIDHIEHIARVAGIDHVGLGSDFDGMPSLPEEIDSAADLPKITAALMERGFSEDDCRKILGLNFLRFFREVQTTAEKLQAERPGVAAE